MPLDEEQLLTGYEETKGRARIRSLRFMKSFCGASKSLDPLWTQLPDGRWAFLGSPDAFSDKTTLRFLLDHTTLPKNFIEDVWLAIGYSRKRKATRKWPKCYQVDILYYHHTLYLYSRICYLYAAINKLANAVVHAQRSNHLGQLVPDGSGTFEDLLDYMPALKVRQKRLKKIVRNLEHHIGFDAARCIMAFMEEEIIEEFPEQVIQKKGKN